MCLAKYTDDQKWYRAYCVESGIGDGFITVIFCDYGNMSTIKIEDIKKFPRDMLTPALSAPCIIKGKLKLFLFVSFFLKKKKRFSDFPEDFENVSKETITKLKEFFESGLMKVSEITKNEDDNYIFYFPEVAKILGLN